MVNPRAKMRRSNQKAIKWLLENDFEMVFLLHHTKWDVLTYFKDSRIKSKDIAGLFDGIAIKNGETVYIQIKSNAFPTAKLYEDFSKKYGVKCLLINVRDRKPISIKEFPSQR